MGYGNIKQVNTEYKIVWL